MSDKVRVATCRSLGDVSARTAEDPEFAANQ
jgi:hypothetical protein